MSHPLVELIVDESKWLTGSMGLAFLAVALLLYGYRSSTVSGRQRILTAMNLFFGVMIGAMASGHLLTVTVKLVAGTLEGSVLLFYVIGIALAIPSWRLLKYTWWVRVSSEEFGRTMLGLNGWLSITLLVLGATRRSRLF